MLLSHVNGYFQGFATPNPLALYRAHRASAPRLAFSARCSGEYIAKPFGHFTEPPRRANLRRSSGVRHAAPWGFLVI